MTKKVVLSICLLISAAWGGGFGKVSIATPAIDRTKILSADIPEPAADLSGLVLTLQELPQGFTEKLGLKPRPSLDGFFLILRLLISSRESI